MLHKKFGFGWPSGFREEDLSNCGRTDDGRTPDHGHPISSPCEPNDSGELKTSLQNFRPGPTQTGLYSHRGKLES